MEPIAWLVGDALRGMFEYRNALAEIKALIILISYFNIGIMISEHLTD